VPIAADRGTRSGLPFCHQRAILETHYRSEAQ
jgi:hypothetical protein